MRKITTIISALFLFSVATAQVPLTYDNGPLITHPGQHSSGADISGINNRLLNYGFNCNFGGKFWITDDFDVPAGETWTVDSIVTYAYQTNSGITPTITGSYVAIMDNDPLTGGTIVWGDTTAALILDTKFSGIYRAGSSVATFTSVARPIMRNAVEATPVANLTAGKYWLIWSASGSVASGPWVSPISYNDSTKYDTGNALQKTSTGWQAIIDTGGRDAFVHPQGMPFLIKGTKVVGIKEIVNNVDIKIYPNPVTVSSTIAITHNNGAGVPSKGYTFVVYDVLGKEVSRTEGVRTSFRFSREGLSNGTYMYELQDENKPVTRGKLIVN